MVPKYFLATTPTKQSSIPTHKPLPIIPKYIFAYPSSKITYIPVIEFITFMDETARSDCETCKKHVKTMRKLYL